MSISCWDVLSFVSREFIIAYWIIFMTAALKSLLDHANIWFISVLASVDYLSHSSCDFPGSWYNEWFLKIVSWKFWLLYHGALDFIWFSFLMWCEGSVGLFSILLDPTGVNSRKRSDDLHHFATGKGGKGSALSSAHWHPPYKNETPTQTNLLP